MKYDPDVTSPGGRYVITHRVRGRLTVPPTHTKARTILEDEERDGHLSRAGIARLEGLRAAEERANRRVADWGRSFLEVLRAGEGECLSRAGGAFDLDDESTWPLMARALGLVHRAGDAGISGYEAATLLDDRGGRVTSALSKLHHSGVIALLAARSIKVQEATA